MKQKRICLSESRSKELTFTAYKVSTTYLARCIIKQYFNLIFVVALRYYLFFFFMCEETFKVRGFKKLAEVHIL